MPEPRQNRRGPARREATQIGSLHNRLRRASFGVPLQTLEISSAAFGTNLSQMPCCYLSSISTWLFRHQIHSHRTYHDGVVRHPEPLEYPFHDRTIRVTHCGRLCFDRRKISLSRVFAGQDVGIREVGDKIWLVSFMESDLGFFDEDERRVEPAVNPFIQKVLPMSPV